VVGEDVAVAEAVAEAVDVPVGVAVFVGVAVGDPVRVGVGLGVLVGVADGIGVGLLVGDGVGVAQTLILVTHAVPLQQKFLVPQNSILPRKPELHVLIAGDPSPSGG